MIPLAPALLIALISCIDEPCPAPKSEPIKVMVLVILGTDKEDAINERLKEIAPELKKKDKTLTGFDLHKTINSTIKMGESITLELIDQAKITVMVSEKTDDEGRATITIKPPKLEEITYGCTCGKFFPILTNYYTADNKRLIIAVMAKPCKK